MYKLKLIALIPIHIIYRIINNSHTYKKYMRQKNLLAIREGDQGLGHLRKGLTGRRVGFEKRSLKKVSAGG